VFLRAMPVEPPNIPLGRAMRRFKIDWCISFTMLFACVLTVAAACVESSGPLGAPNVLQVGTVSSVQITLAKSTLNPGQATQATVVAKSADGKLVSGRVDYLSKNPTIATASSDGVVTGIAAGTAVIQATMAGHAATTAVIVQSFDSSADSLLASQNFDGGSVSPYVNLWDPAAGGNGDVDVVDDPTRAGKGKVARMHYVGTHQDRNRHLQFSHRIGFGTTIYSSGEFYLDVADLGDGLIGRKLIYYRPHADYLKYGAGGRGGPEFATVVGLMGHSLYVNSFYIPADGSPAVETHTFIVDTLLPRTWYTLETQLTPETSIGAGNGIVRVWLDGALVYEKTDLQWTDPAWIGQPMANGTPLELADVYLERVEVGEQVNYMIGTFDEYRYWDKVAFSTKRIGH
jgi:hypothetical protein